MSRTTASKEFTLANVISDFGVNGLIKMIKGEKRLYDDINYTGEYARYYILEQNNTPMPKGSAPRRVAFTTKQFFTLLREHWCKNNDSKQSVGSTVSLSDEDVINLYSAIGLPWSDEEQHKHSSQYADYSDVYQNITNSLTDKEKYTDLCIKIATALSQDQHKNAGLLSDIYQKAVAKDNKKLIAYFAEHRIAITTTENNNETRALINAAIDTNDIKLFNNIIQPGAATFQNSIAEIPDMLHYAITKFDKHVQNNQQLRPVIIEHLIALSDNLNAKAGEEQQTPLMVACKLGNSKAVQSLIAYQAVRDTYNLQDDNGNTALNLALINGHTDCVKALLSSNYSHTSADSLVACTTNNEGLSALHTSVQQQNIEALKLLLTLPDIHSAIVNTRDALGNTPLHTACALPDESKYKQEIIKLIVSNADSKIVGQRNNNKEFAQTMLCTGTLTKEAAHEFVNTPYPDYKLNAESSSDFVAIKENVLDYLQKQEEHIVESPIMREQLFALYKKIADIDPKSTVYNPLKELATLLQKECSHYFNIGGKRPYRTLRSNTIKHIKALHPILANALQDIKLHGGIREWLSTPVIPVQQIVHPIVHRLDRSEPVNGGGGGSHIDPKSLGHHIEVITGKRPPAVSPEFNDTVLSESESESESDASFIGPRISPQPQPPSPAPGTLRQENKSADLLNNNSASVPASVDVNTTPAPPPVGIVARNKPSPAPTTPFDVANLPDVPLDMPDAPSGSIHAKHEDRQPVAIGVSAGIDTTSPAKPKSNDHPKTNQTPQPKPAPENHPVAKQTSASSLDTMPKADLKAYARNLGLCNGSLNKETIAQKHEIAQLQAENNALRAAFDRSAEEHKRSQDQRAEARRSNMVDQATQTPEDIVERNKTDGTQSRKPSIFTDNLSYTHPNREKKLFTPARLAEQQAREALKTQSDLLTPNKLQFQKITPPKNVERVADNFIEQLQAEIKRAKDHALIPNSGHNTDSVTDNSERFPSGWYNG